MQNFLVTRGNHINATIGGRAVVVANHRVYESIGA